MLWNVLLQKTIWFDPWSFKWRRHNWTTKENDWPTWRTWHAQFTNLSFWWKHKRYRSIPHRGSLYKFVLYISTCFHFLYNLYFEISWANSIRLTIFLFRFRDTCIKCFCIMFTKCVSSFMLSPFVKIVYSSQFLRSHVKDYVFCLCYISTPSLDWIFFLNLHKLIEVTWCLLADVSIV